MFTCGMSFVTGFKNDYCSFPGQISQWCHQRVLTSILEKVTHLLLPLFYFLSFTFPAVIFRSHRSRNVSWVGFDLLRARLLKPEVIAPLKVFLLFQEGLPFSFRILHVIADDLVIRWNPWRYVLHELLQLTCRI